MPDYLSSQGEPGIRVQWNELHRADLTMDQARDLFGLKGTHDSDVLRRLKALQSASLLPFSAAAEIITAHRTPVPPAEYFVQAPVLTSVRIPRAEPEPVRVKPEWIPLHATVHGQAFLRRLLEDARALTEPEEVNSEYVRGQVNLIMDVMGLSGDSFYDVMWEVITHETTVARGMAAINKIINEIGSEIG